MLFVSSRSRGAKRSPNNSDDITLHIAILLPNLFASVFISFFRSSRRKIRGNVLPYIVKVRKSMIFVEKSMNPCQTIVEKTKLNGMQKIGFGNAQSRNNIPHNVPRGPHIKARQQCSFIEKASVFLMVSSICSWKRIRS